MTESEVWKTRYQVLKSAVVGACGTADVIGKSMTGREYIDLICAGIKAIEDGGKHDVTENEGEDPAVAPHGM